MCTKQKGTAYKNDVEEGEIQIDDSGVDHNDALAGRNDGDRNNEDSGEDNNEDMDDQEGENQRVDNRDGNDVVGDADVANENADDTSQQIYDQSDVESQFSPKCVGKSSKSC